MVQVEFKGSLLTTEIALGMIERDDLPLGDGRQIREDGRESFPSVANEFQRERHEPGNDTLALLKRLAIRLKFWAHPFHVPSDFWLAGSPKLWPLRLTAPRQMGIAGVSLQLSVEQQGRGEDFSGGEVHAPAHRWLGRRA